MHLDQAAKSLEEWWRERLTVDPRISSPFYDLSSNLIGTMLDLVDWKAIVEAMRERED
jgi:hypothetical protein